VRRPQCAPRRARLRRRAHGAIQTGSAPDE
jgi:hypothetical protein